VKLSQEDVLAILALLDASEFDELRIESADYKLHLRRSQAGPVPDSSADLVSSGPAPPKSSPPSPVEAAGDRDVFEIKAPMLGTFYASPQPGAPSFVNVGAVVDENTVVGIIEVMKLMNAVSAGTGGVVVEIVAKDGQLVEYGQVLVRIARSIS
jgi:acetyl-CoA carboxylase biotin carboxyl carrier protein